MKRLSHAFYKHVKKKTGLHFTTLYDLFMFIVAFIGPLMTFPQVATVWMVKHHQGVSLVTWLTYGMCGIAWLLYGYIHRQKLIIFSQIIVVLLDFSIVLGMIVAVKF